MRKICIFVALLVSFGFSQSNKSVNVKVKGLPQSYSSLRIDTLSRCIIGLPENVTAAAEGRTEYLKNISGTNKNDYVKTWNASVSLTYQWKYKLHYLVMPQGGLDAQAPVFHETEGTTPVTEYITGNSQDSDFFAFANPRRYYFNSEVAAQNSAIKYARQRISELKSLECK